jgi:hypothetical protein
MIPCLICEKKFIRPLSHVWQKHGINHKEYKEQFGLDVQKGIATEEYKERMREHIKQNPHVILENLLIHGKKTRIKKGQVIPYERSQQTLERLKHRARYTLPHDGRKAILPPFTFSCATVSHCKDQKRERKKPKQFLLSVMFFFIQ